MADVAAAAGVSSQTVSRVANGADVVAASTRERVLAAMHELGYRPNAAARALRSGTARSIGVVAFDMTTTGTLSTLTAISQAADTLGYSVTLVAERTRTSTSVSSSLSRLRDMAVDGLIVIIDSVPDDDAPTYHLPTPIPLVVVDSDPASGHVRIDIDQEVGAVAAVDHLLQLGHATVHHLGGPQFSNAARIRTLAWRNALERAGRRVPPAVFGDWTAQSGYEVGMELVRSEKCTAVFCSNDEMAMGLLRAAHETGRQVPGDLSIVGFDDIPVASNMFPPLTTVRQDFTSMGQAAMDRLMNMIHHGASGHEPTLIIPELVVRASTAPPRSDTAER